MPTPVAALTAAKAAPVVLSVAGSLVSDHIQYKQQTRLSELKTNEVVVTTVGIIVVGLAKVGRDMYHDRQETLRAEQETRQAEINLEIERLKAGR